MEEWPAGNTSYKTYGIRKGVFEYYTFLWNDYLKDFEDETKYPDPKLNTSHVIDSMIKPKTIHMASKIEVSYFGICFRCTFEDEHGLGIELRDYKIEEVGGENVGFSLHADK